MQDAFLIRTPSIALKLSRPKGSNCSVPLSQSLTTSMDSVRWPLCTLYLDPVLTAVEELYPPDVSEYGVRGVLLHVVSHDRGKVWPLSKQTDRPCSYQQKQFRFQISRSIAEKLSLSGCYRGEPLFIWTIVLNRDVSLSRIERHLLKVAMHKYGCSKQSGWSGFLAWPLLIV